MNIKLCFVLAPFLCIALAQQSVLAQMATVDFESQVAGTQYGGGSLGSAPGDLVFSEDNIGVRIDEFELGMFTGFIRLGIGDQLGNRIALVNNILVDFDLSGLSGSVTHATFDFTDNGGDENLVVNGARLELSEFMSAPASLGGVNISVTTLPIGSIRGTVTLDGPINSLGIGGQELQIDNVRFRYTPIPEPMSGVLLGGGVMLASMRRSRH